MLDRNNTLINEINHNHYGRYPDGGDAWGFHQTATPGWSNAAHFK